MNRPSQDMGMAPDEEVDLLVVGGGAAGMTAALTAAIEGHRALLCEKSSYVGGTSARSSGGIWIPGNAHTARAGKPDSIENARTYLSAFFGPNAPNKARETYLAQGPEIIDYLEANSELRFEPMATHPDYRPYEGAAMGGRPLGSLPFDGRKLGRDFRLVALPLPALVALGGMMVGRADIPHFLKPFGSVKSFFHVARAVGRYCVDRLSHNRGTHLLMGNALVGRLLLSLKERNVPIWTNARVVELLREGARVTGALVERDGTRVRIHARAGVILATGGFSHGSTWRQALMSPAEAKTLSLAYEANEGDGLSLASSAGADVGRGDLRGSSVWSPISLYRNKDGSETKYPHFFMDRPKPGFIAVGKSGKRFVNEAASYHDFVAGMLASKDVMNDLPAYLICDAAALERFGLGMVLPGRRSLRKYVAAGYLTLADSIEELATRLGIDVAQLHTTVIRNNAMAAAGIDEDFGKGSSALNRFHGDANRPDNPCLGPIAKPPFAAVGIWPADLSTYAGVKGDEHGQALSAQNQPIPGLHVCGNDLRSIFEGEAPGPGVTLGPAIVFAVLAARHALASDPAASVQQDNAA